MILRLDGRSDLDIRPIKFQHRFYGYGLSNILIEMGRTVVSCSVSLSHGVPKFLKGTSSGWLSAEYQMLPSSTHERTVRDHYRNQPNGRSIEIQRLISRTLRQSLHLEKLGEQTLTVDCDILQADGGTRIAAINGGSLALALACHRLEKEKKILPGVFKGLIAGISCGYVQQRFLVDLSYQEDSQADSDGFFIINETGSIIGADLSVENLALSPEQWQTFCTHGYAKAQEILETQRKMIASALDQLS